MSYKYPRHASVKVGNICNSKCLGCDISSGDKGYVLETEKIKEELLQIKKAGFESVELIGGEITIQKNFFELFSFASSIFPEITLATNGRVLAYEGFVKEMVNLAPPKFNLEIALHGSNQLLQESFTRSPGSFKEMIAGIKNIIKYKNYFNNLGINTLVLKTNYQYLDKILDLILSFKTFKTWYLLSFVPVEGRALDNIKILIPRYKDLLILNPLLAKAHHYFEGIDLDGFPYCLFNFEILNNKKDRIHIVNSDLVELEEDKKIIRNFNPTFSFNKIDYLSNISAFPKRKKIKSLHESFRVKLAICQNCLFSTDCRGVWKKYLNLFGKNNVNEELRYLKQINFSLEK